MIAASAAPAPRRGPSRRARGDLATAIRAGGAAATPRPARPPWRHGAAAARPGRRARAACRARSRGRRVAAPSRGRRRRRGWPGRPVADDDLDRHRGLVGAGDEIELVGDLRGRRVPGVGDAEAALVRGHDRTQRGDRADEHLGDDVVPVDGHQLRHGRAQRPAQQRERAGEAEPVGQLGVGGRELGAGLRGDRAEVVDHRVLVGQPHVLVGVDAPRRVHRQAEVDPPRVEAREGQRRGHGGLGTRRVGEVPRHDDGRLRPLVLRRDDDDRNSVSQLHAVQYTGRCTVAQCRVAPDSGRA